MKIPDSAPVIYVIGGPNGSGKSTFAREFLPAAGMTEFLNADSIAAGLSPLNPAAAAIRASRLLLNRWRELVNESRSFSFESTLSGRSYAVMLRDAKQRGYQIRLCYLYLASVKHSVRRVHERVKKGGHDVPLPDLRRRYLLSLRNFFQLICHWRIRPRSTTPPCNRHALWHVGMNPEFKSPPPPLMNLFSPARKPVSPEVVTKDGFFDLVDAAMLRAARRVKAENRRLGLPLIAEKPHRRQRVGCASL